MKQTTGQESGKQLGGADYDSSGTHVGEQRRYPWMDIVRYGFMLRCRTSRLCLPHCPIVEYCIPWFVRVHRRQTMFNVQGFVGKSMVFHADVIGVNLSRPGSPGGDEEG